MNSIKDENQKWSEKNILEPKMYIKIYEIYETYCQLNVVSR